MLGGRGENLIRYHGVLAGVPWWGKLVERPEDLREFIQWVNAKAASGERVCFDSEAHGLGIFTYGPGYLRLCQFGTETETYVVPVEHGPAFMDAARYALETLPSLVGHNVVMHDGLAVDKHLGVPLETLCPKTLDTLVTSKLIDPRNEMAGGIGHGLKRQASYFVDPSSPDTQDGLEKVFKSLKVGHTRKNPVGWSRVPWNHPVYVVYSIFDVILGSRLANAHEKEMKRLGIRQALVPYEHALIRMCATMTRTGMLVDRPYTETLYGHLDEEWDTHTARAERYGVDSVNSPAKVRDALWGMGERWTETTDTGALSVGKSVLLPMADLDKDWQRIGARTPNPLADAVLHAKRAGKWRSAYVDTFLESSSADGRVHPNIQTLEARTGRMSITRPAVQTLPSGDWMIRRCLLAEEGHRMVSVDFTAVEMRVLAALADVSRMKHAITTDQDLHDYTASLVFGEGFTKSQRKLAKGIGFGKVFGGGAATIQKQTGAPLADIQRAIKSYDQVYPEIKRASARWQREAFGQSMVTYTATGRRLPLDRDRTYAVVNYQCQSAARDILGRAMLKMDAAGLLPYLRLPIHDEVLASVPEADAHDVAREITRCMEGELRGVPIAADPEVMGRSWGSGYLKDTKGKFVPGLMIKHDPYWSAHPEEAYAATA